jgi:hypothetical protein
MEQRIELRSAGGPLLGVLILGAMRLQVKRGHRMFEVDLLGTQACGEPVVFERVLYPDGVDEVDRVDEVDGVRDADTAE